GSHFGHQALAFSEIGGLDGIVKFDGHLARTNGKPRFWHAVFRPGNRDGHDRNVALFGEIERAFFEGQQLAIERTVTFDVDGHVNSLVDDSERVAYRRDPRIAIATVDRHERAERHDAAENWNLEQFFLHHHRRAARDQRQGERR